MPRQPRVVVPDQPHHVTQRGNRRSPIFFEAGDEQIYLDLMVRECRRREVGIWAYCLMPNHVHLVLTPRSADGLGLAVGEAHRRYTNYVNIRGGWTGHLFQSRFASVAMDEAHVLAAFRYISLNPVRARLVARAEDWAWSSARAHIKGVDDGVVAVAPALARFDGFADLLAAGAEDEADRFAALRAAETTGRPVGSAAFIAGLERRLGRALAAPRRGRPVGSKIMMKMV
ncbi:MAG TPA: transposase [Caulobacteraceae bacterium]|nr:transposase [Caulobacteraceae bacterium]